MTTRESRTALEEYPISVRTVVEMGLVLPWEIRARYGPPVDAVEKGELLESGEVFVPLDDLYAVNEQGEWDSQFGLPPLLLGLHAGLALEQAGLAFHETRGGYHRTPKLSVWIEEYEAHKEKQRGDGGSTRGEVQV